MTGEHLLTRPVHVVMGDVCLDGDLTVPAGARGLVLFAHGSGSSRHSARNHFVARTLERRGLATLLIDLLTPDEEILDRQSSDLRFDIPLLATRLEGIIDWLRREPETAALRLGLFGASTGGGAALVAAANRPHAVAAIVSRGGRPDLAGAALARVSAPTLLIVGSMDAPVLFMNRRAMTEMRAHVELTLVPGATHLFEEAGALERVAELAGDWFSQYVPGQPATASGRHRA